MVTTQAKSRIFSTYARIRSGAAILFCIVGMSISAGAQELKPNVIVDINALPLNQRDDIVTMQSDVLQYLSNQRYTNKDWEGEKIPIDVTVFIMTGNQQQKRYGGRLFFNSRVNLSGGITSPILKVLDQAWSFPYTLNQQLSYQTLRFDEFSTLLDFYNFIALGLDADCFEQLSGRAFYEQARELVLLGANRSAAGYSTLVAEPGEFTRISLVTELLNPRFEEFRKLIFEYHADGMDKLAKNKEAARAGVAAVIKKMADYKRNKVTQRSYFMQLFFDAKQTELAELFKGTNNTDMLDAMRTLDPANFSVFEQAVRK